MRQITNNQESDRTDLQRAIAGFQNEEIAFDRKAVEFEGEIGNLKSQLNYEASRYKEMESIVQVERRSAHDSDGQIQSLRRQNEDLVMQADRLNLRVESKYKTH
jgi:chromosome segregation ATPase